MSWTVAAVAYLLVLAWATLNPSSGPASSSVGTLRALAEAVGAPYWLAETAEPIANVAIFVPLPVLAAAIGYAWPVRAWLLIGLLASSSIELVQRVALEGRTPSILDITTNTTGAVVGGLLVQWIARIRARRPVPSPAYVETPRN